MAAPTFDTGASATDIEDLSNLNATGSQTLSITPSNSNELIVVVAALYAESSSLAIAAPTATGLTFTQRTLQTSAVDYESCYFQVGIWYAVASGTGANTITVSFSGGSTSVNNYFIINGFCVIGANNSAPWDPNASLPSTTFNLNGSGGPLGQPQATVSTTNADDFLFAIGIGGSNNAAGQAENWTPLSENGTTISSHSLTPGFAELTYQSAYGTYTGAVQTNVTAGYTASSATYDWALLVDAITADSSSGPPPSPPPAQVTVAEIILRQFGFDDVYQTQPVTPPPPITSGGVAVSPGATPAEIILRQFGFDAVFGVFSPSQSSVLAVQGEADAASAEYASLQIALSGVASGLSTATASANNSVSGSSSSSGGDYATLSLSLTAETDAASAEYATLNIPPAANGGPSVLPAELILHQFGFDSAFQNVSGSTPARPTLPATGTIVSTSGMSGTASVADLFVATIASNSDIEATLVDAASLTGTIASTSGLSGTLTAAGGMAPYLDAGGSASSYTNRQYTTSSTGSVNYSITPTNPGELIVVVAYFSSNATTTAVSSVSATGLTFTQRTRKVAAADWESYYAASEIWWAVAPGTGPYSITVSWGNGGSENYFNSDTFCVIGANNSAPWDPNASLPSWTTNVSNSSSSATSATVSTSDPDDFLFAAATASYASGQTTANTWTPLAENPTSIASQNLTPGPAELSSQLAYGTYTAVQTGVAAGYNNSTYDWGLLVDAITANSGTQAPTSVAIPGATVAELILRQFGFDSVFATVSPSQPSALAVHGEADAVSTESATLQIALSGVASGLSAATASANSSQSGTSSASGGDYATLTEQLSGEADATSLQYATIPSTIGALAGTPILVAELILGQYGFDSAFGTFSPSLSSVLPMQGEADAVSTQSATLTINLSGTCAGAASANASMVDNLSSVSAGGSGGYGSPGMSLTSTAAGLSTASAPLIELVTAQAAGNATAYAQATEQLSAVASGLSGGSSVPFAALQSTAAGTSTAYATLTVKIAVSGTASAVSTNYATISGITLEQVTFIPGGPYSPWATGPPQPEWVTAGPSSPWQTGAPRL